MSIEKSKRLSLMLRRIKKHWSLGNMPIFTKLFLIFGLFFLSMVFLSLFTFARYKADKDQSTLTAIQQMNEQAVSKIDDYVNDLKNATKLPLFQESMENDFIREFDKFNHDNAHSLLLQKLSEQIAYRIFNFKSTIHSVFFFNLQGESEYKIKNSSIYKKYNPKDEPWFSQSIDAFGKPVVISTFTLPYTTDTGNIPVNVFSVSRGIVNVDNSQVIGVVLVNSSIDFLSKLCNNMLMYPGQRTCIADKAGKVIYDTANPGSISVLENSFLDIVSAEETVTRSVRYNNVEMLLDYKISNTTGWKIITAIPSHELNKNIDRLRRTTAIITVILILLVFLFLFLISSRIVRPLKKLVLLMKLIQKGDFNVKIKFKSRDEVGQLAKTFNWMIYKIKKMINDAYVEKIRQKDLELKMLQYQINPHFLYNSLESIHMMAEINRDQETSNMVQALGKFLRYGISRQLDIVTIRDEINNLKNYILLQEVRFEDIFHIEVDIDDTLYDIPIIKLILQPLVENAIYHGLSSIEENGSVKISGRRENDLLFFEVTDNGVGMDAHQVSKLNDYLNDLNYSFKSIGLKNVHKRIQLHYGNNYGLNVISKKGQGTTIRVTLPWVR